MTERPERPDQPDRAGPLEQRQLIPDLTPEQRGLGAALPGLSEGLTGEFTILELADRLLHRGVVIAGEATISVAGVDLIYLGLNVVLTAVENLLPDKDKPPERHPERSEGSASPTDASLRSA